MPAQFANLQLALDYLADKRIADTAEVTIQIADGTYTMTKSLVILHPDANKILIQGNDTTPGNVVLNFPTTGDGILVRGVFLRWLSGMKIKSTGNTTGRGLRIDRANIDGGKIQTDGFRWGVYINGNSYYAIADTTIANSSHFGLTVRNGSYGIFTDISITSCPTAVLAEYDGSITITDGAISTATTGFSLSNRAYIQALSSDVTLTGVGSVSNITANTTSTDRSYLYR